MPNTDNFTSVADEYRRARLFNTEQFLSRACPQEVGLEELGRAFARAHEAYPDLSGWIYINEIPTPSGPGSLEFRELATRGMSVLLGVLGESDWENWLEVLLSYLLQNDTQQEFLRIFSCGHLEGPAGSTPETYRGVLIEGENYEIHHLFKVSEQCCAWLNRRYRRASRRVPASPESAEDGGASRTGPPQKATVSNPPGNPFSAGRVCGTTGNTNRLLQAMAQRGLTAPKLTKEICAVLRRRGAIKTSVDRATVYRLISGKTRNPNLTVWNALLAVLKLPEDETFDSMMRPNKE